MKSLIQTYLIGGGVVGFVLLLPMVGYAWMMHTGFDGDLTWRSHLLLCSPVICAVAAAAGVVWKRADQKRQGNPPDTNVSRTNDGDS